MAVHRVGAVRIGLALAASGAFAIGIAGMPGSVALPTPDRHVAEVEFNRDIRPILDKCLSCHGHDPKAIQAGLRLDRRDGATARLGNGERAIVPGHPERSALIARISAKDPAMRMPPPSSNRVLSSEEKATLSAWIAQGAEYKPHWAFVAPVRPTVPDARRLLLALQTPVFIHPTSHPTPNNSNLKPQTSNLDWTQSPIDAFVLSKLVDAGLSPSAKADRGTLIRRVSLDLTGLPPTPAELDAFLSDKSPKAYERVVDRLLSSPRYGERMAMEWLDEARYADSNGYQNDYERYQFRWRDWVIDAFNRDMPYDEFTVEQLAGDLLPHPTVDQVVATGFCRNNRLNTEGGAIPEEYHDEYLMDRVQTVSAVWLGLTTGCARCHDHKYDPITQRDFYRLCAYFNNVPETDIGEEKPKNYPPVIQAPYPEQAAALSRLTKELAPLQKEAEERIAASENAAQTWKGPPSNPPKTADGKPATHDLLKIPPDKRAPDQRKAIAKAWLISTDETFQKLDGHVSDLEKRKAALDAVIPTVMVMTEMPQPRDMFVLLRGEYDHHGERVTADTPAFLPHLPAGAANNRLALARWIVSPSNPLTARVTVNRMWERLFGTGIVETSEDFGTRSSFPSHPELLNWLATELVAKHWDLKAMWKELVTSATYRQSSAVTPKLLAVDPANRLLARGPRFRLSAEVIRDQAMFAGGYLTEKIGGPSVRPYAPKGVWDETAGLNGNLRNYQHDTGPDLHRRSLYTIWKRTAPPPDMVLFDAPSREICTVRRARTDTPLQALALLNDVTYVEAARGLAQRMIREGGQTPLGRIRLAFRALLSRDPLPAEAQILTSAVARNLAHYHADPRAALALVEQGDLTVDQVDDVSELAAYTLVAGTVLNMDETVTKR